MGRLDNKVALISGGATGMGGAASRLFAAEGVAVQLLRCQSWEEIDDLLRLQRLDAEAAVAPTLSRFFERRRRRR